MTDEPLSSFSHYSRFVAELLHRPPVERSTVSVWFASPYTGVAEGEFFFTNDIRLRVREELDFEAGLITSYGYVIYWYDDFPHPNDPSLASTFPHHKHVPPNIKRNRIPAPDMSFTQPNLTVLIQEIEVLIQEMKNQ